MFLISPNNFIIHLDPVTFWGGVLSYNYALFAKVCGGINPD